MTHSTKKIERLLPFSASTALGSDGAVVVVLVAGTSTILPLVSVALLCVRFASADGFMLADIVTLETLVPCNTGDGSAA